MSRRRLYSHASMRTAVPEKLLKIVDEIQANGDVPITRLTVLKKWFEKKVNR